MPGSVRASLAQLPRGATPVVLLGGINLVRAIGLAGYPVVVASRDRDDPALDSRYCRARLMLSGNDDAVLETLEDAGRLLGDAHGRRVPLAYGNDDWLRFVHAHRRRLEACYAMLLNDPALGEALLDKQRFARLARDTGLPVPAELRWEAGHPASLAAWHGPVLVKPATKVGWEQSALLAALFGGEGKALVVENGRRAVQHPSIARFRNQLVFQEFVAGSDEWCFDGVADRGGRILAGYTGRKLRMYPLDAGDSAYIEMAAQPGLDAVARDIARRLGLRGIFNMDFKRDPRDGAWRLLEINARYNFWLYMSTRNGLNLVRVLHDYLLTGARPEPAPARGARYRWIDFGLDRAAYRALRARGEMGFARWAWSLASRRKVYSVFSWSDPLPFLRGLARRIASRVASKAKSAKFRVGTKKA